MLPNKSKRCNSICLDSASLHILIHLSSDKEIHLGINLNRHPLVCNQETD